MNFSFRSFYQSGILGLNARNLDYIQKYNQRKYYPNADSKFLSKELALKAKIPVPKMYGIISFSVELNNLKEKIAEHKSLVIKPEHGSGGNGIMIIEENNGILFDGNTKISWPKLRYHATNILSGLYSLGGQVDRILLEEKVNFANIFKDITYRGVPDIRVIIFKGIPVMAMLRLPTSKSHGKANLHQGAVGVGINLKTGKTRGGVLNSKSVSKHPDTKNTIDGLTIPNWREILEIAVKASQVFNLGYMGVDIVHDREKGPLMLEANVRPGLAIQLANQIGLKKRLAIIEKTNTENFSLDDKIDFPTTSF